MALLRKFVCGCFGFLCCFFLFVASLQIMSLGWGLLHGRAQHFYSFTQGGRPLWAFLLLPLSIAVRFLPLLIGVIYGLSWWKVRSLKPSGRGWAIAASIVSLVQGAGILAMLFANWAMVLRRLRSLSELAAFLVALGLLGLLAFSAKDAVVRSGYQPKPARIAGDGVSRVAEALAWVVGVGGYWALLYGMERWAKGRGLPFAPEHAWLLRLFLALLLSTTLHEAGHLLVGLAVGMKPRALLVGPFLWQNRHGRWRFRLQLAGLWNGGGATAMLPADPKMSARKEMLMIVAGPLASLLTGAAAAGLLWTAKGGPLEPYWLFVATVAALGFVGFVVNLLPIRARTLYSDGARLYQLLRGGPWADLHRITSLAGATLLTPLRPRDYEIDVIERALAHFSCGQYALLLRLLACDCYLDRGDLLRASASLRAAEEAFPGAAAEAPKQWLPVLVSRSVILTQDAAAAARWWKLAESAKPDCESTDYWLGRSALLLLEGRREEALDVWSRGWAICRTRPAAGAYNFDRDCFYWLRGAIERPETVFPQWAERALA